MNLARAGNKYFNDSEPWITVKSDKERCGTTLNVCLHAIYTLAGLFSPVIPFSSEKIFGMLNSSPVVWGELGGENLQTGHILNKTEIIFPKIEDEIIEQQVEKLGPKTEEDIKNNLISIEDFDKIKLKVAEIVEAVNVPKSNKLLKLKVRLDDGERQVLAGIAKSYKPEDLVGKKIILVANLKPAKLMGLESNGMVLAVENEDGGLNILTVDQKVKNGTRAK
jgi:methionyl-tRNA synthetase